MKTIQYKYFVGDFETTVYENQTDTEVWASAVVELYSDDVKIFNSIDETFEYLCNLDTNICIYYHNLKFDGNFWLSFLLTQLCFEQAVKKLSDKEYDLCFLDDKEMKNKTFKYSISSMGQWYSIKIKINNHFIEIRDSLKLLPFSVKQIGQSFQTKHKKLEMEYSGFRYAGCYISDEEKEYIKNDVLVVKEALEIMFNDGHNKITIGSCCLYEFKSSFENYEYKELFPNLYEIKIDENKYKYKSAGEYIRKSYRGGWCYLVKSKRKIMQDNGCTCDVNSLYPSMMSSESGNYYPVGAPNFWKGNYIPLEAQEKNKYYFVRISTRFYLKKNMLPCIQIKNNFMYRSNEWLERSDIFNKDDNKYYNRYVDFDNNIQLAKVTLTLTETDYNLIKEHYDLIDFEILDGCYFEAERGIFDKYIEKYKKIKLESKGAIRELAKLFLNNLYGKMATSTNSSFKYAFIKEDNSIGFVEIIEEKKKPGYIAIGSAITSYARNFTIRAAQKNYYGKDNPGFIYADTDSIHCTLKPAEIKGINIHDKNFCCWKIESSWNRAIFIRQKTYIENIVQENQKDIEHPYLNIKCAGMPDECKILFLMALKKKSENDWKNFIPEEWEKNNYIEWNSLSDEKKKFILNYKDLRNFNVGLKIPGKLLPKRIRGGIVLKETTYEMR